MLLARGEHVCPDVIMAGREGRIGINEPRWFKHAIHRDHVVVIPTNEWAKCRDECPPRVGRTVGSSGSAHTGGRQPGSMIYDVVDWLGKFFCR